MRKTEHGIRIRENSFSFATECLPQVCTIFKQKILLETKESSLYIIMKCYNLWSLIEQGTKQFKNYFSSVRGNFLSWNITLYNGHRASYKLTWRLKNISNKTSNAYTLSSRCSRNLNIVQINHPKITWNLVKYSAASLKEYPFKLEYW